MSMVSKACEGLIVGAALIVLPAPALAQDTTTNNVTAADPLATDTANVATTADPYATTDTANVATTADPYATTDNTVTTTTRQEHDDDFPWGLLGLLGLGGLLGLKKREHARDINVDARSDTRR